MDLMRFRIPTGWRVAQNCFYDVEPEEDHGFLLPQLVFVEDIMWLVHEACGQNDGEGESYSIFLGWFPDEDPEGRFRLELVQGGSEDILPGDYESRILCEYESRDRWEIRDKLETWLEVVSASQIELN